jgi:hypothetical protein
MKTSPLRKPSWQIAKIKPGPEMDALRKKIRQLDTASYMSEWFSSPGLQPPKTE